MPELLNFARGRTQGPALGRRMDGTSSPATMACAELLLEKVNPVGNRPPTQDHARGRNKEEMRQFTCQARFVQNVAERKHRPVSKTGKKASKVEGKR